jgi:8-oxo-dGTP pyrophosphatase MutT (NUDIX family)
MTHHAKLDKHYTAGVFIFSNTLPAKVLLIHHKKLERWLHVGGHQEEHENPVEAAVREVEEETGLDISGYLSQVTPMDDRVNIIPRPDYLLEERIPAHGHEHEHYHIDQIYVVRIPEQPPHVPKREAHDVRWFTLEETEALELFPNTRTIIRQEMYRI